ncbi:MAG: hypothetical protein HFI86_03110 [Bacilli bacterium]|nr:hypothetical protein [Bacilli bacterium]
MKLKIALFFSIVILSVFLIYLTLLDKSISYLALGDFLTVGVTAETQDNYSFADYVYEYLEEKNVVDEYIKDFADNTYRTTDLIRDIKDNKQIEIDGKTRTLKNALIKADLLTVTVGTNDVISIMSSENSNSNFYDYLDSILVDMEELFGLLRQYCKEDIIVIGYYNPYFGNKKYESAFSYMNTKVNYLSQKYGINYVDIYDLYASNLDFLPVINDIHPSSKGYSSIFDMVKPVLDDTILK